MHDVMLTDLPARVIGGLPASTGVGDGWIPVTYATESFHGTGLATGYASEAPALTLRLDLEGEYVLYLGLGCYDSIRVWLDGDDGFREITAGHGGHRFMEARLHLTDLTGRNLHIAPVPASRYRDGDSHLFLGYLRAAREAPMTNARNLVATNDGYSWIALDGMASVHDVHKMFAPYRDSDFYRMLWGPAGADVSGNHCTQLGTTLPFDFTHAYRRCDRQYSETIGRILSQGGDILAEAVTAAREVAMELHFYIRPEAYYAPFPYHGYFTSQFLTEHPEWRCRDEFGGEILRMSYAYPQVQRHMLDYLEELLRYDPDGICFAFNRSLPMMLCEAPVLEAFRDRYGRDPRLPEEHQSPEMLAMRQQLLAGFVREVNAVLAARGKVFSAIADFDHEANLRNGLDVEQLARERLLEAVYTTGYCPQSTFWSELRNDCPALKVYSSIHYAHAPELAAPDPFNHQWQATTLKSVLNAGFAGTWYWDTDAVNQNAYNWHVFRRGGSPAYLDRVIADDPDVRVRFHAYTEMLGVTLNRYNPMTSY